MRRELYMAETYKMNNLDVSDVSLQKDLTVSHPVVIAFRDPVDINFGSKIIKRVFDTYR